MDVLNHVSRDYIPVIASVGADGEGDSYNVNADEAAGAVARALGAYKMIFLTDVPGWLADPDDPASLIAQATRRAGRRGAARACRAVCTPSCTRALRAIRGWGQLRPHHRRAPRAFAAPGAVHRCRHRHQDRSRAVSLSALQAIERTSVIPSYARFPVEFVRGEGPYLWDDEGREYLDFLCGISVTNVGHCHPHVVAAVREQAGRLMHASNLFLHPTRHAPRRALIQEQSRRQGLFL